jgi:hypothetical protein
MDIVIKQIHSHSYRSLADARFYFWMRMTDREEDRRMDAYFLEMQFSTEVYS